MKVNVFFLIVVVVVVSGLLYGAATPVSDIVPGLLHGALVSVPKLTYYRVVVSDGVVGLTALADGRSLIGVNVVERLTELYLNVATKAPNGITRIPAEITPDYINDLVKKCSGNNGLMLVAVDKTLRIVGAVSKHRGELAAFAHTLGGGTSLVHTDFGGKGTATELWRRFLELVEAEFFDVFRVELYVRASNDRAISIYEKAGFSIEGRLPGRILRDDGTLEADLIMGWLNQKATTCSMYSPKVVKGS